MILQALNRYYQILMDDPKADIAPPGFSRIPIHAAIVVSEEGDLLGFTSLMVEEQRGKRKFESPTKLLVPGQVLRTGKKILPNFLWDNVTYVLGLSEADDKPPEYTRQRYLAFKEFNLELLSSVDNKTASAAVKFLRKFDQEGLKDNPLLLDNVGLLNKANVVFKILGSEGFIHEDEEIKEAWKAHLKSSSDAPLGQCLVTGEISEIELTHNKIKRIPGGQPAGTAIVSFNERAYESFNKTNRQGLNAPVSKDAMFSYTTALNYLLQRQQNRIILDDTTVVFWAESTNPAYVNMFTAILNPEADKTRSKRAQRDEKAEYELGQLMSALKAGQSVDVGNLIMDLDPQIRFNVLGLSPNAARLSVRFYYTNPFSKSIRNLVTHHANMELINEFSGKAEYYPIWRIIKETVSKKARKGKAAPLLEGAVIRSVLMNLPYPAALYNAILTRIRADQDDKKAGITKINHLRAAIIKAYLIRKYRNQNKYQEELQMSLNKDSTNQAYLLGRLFAVLEKAQQDAAGRDLNATIKDRYFTSACATPSTTFPVLLRLSQHYITKSDYGRLTDRRIQDIMGKLEVEETPFPKHLNLDEQGIFVLGYYHQKADFYKPNTDVKKLENQED